MVSMNERQKLALAFEKMQKHNDRQKAALDRMAAAHIELSAALFEIAEGELDADGMRQRAKDALTSVAARAAATRPDQGESTEEGKYPPPVRRTRDEPSV